MTAKERRRANRRMKHQREALLEMKNMYGNKDQTAYNAVLTSIIQNTCSLPGPCP